VLSSSSLQAALELFVEQERLPPAYLQTVEQWFLPLAHTVLQRAAVSRRTLVVGISGSQGSGKSTLASLLVLMLRELMGLRCTNLSLDDFYHTHQHRQQLARDVHPLLATRGVPGTHDVALLQQTLAALAQEGPVQVPRFNKAMDDRLPQTEWTPLLAPLDVVVLEGWCLCIPPQPDCDLEQPLNALETQEDCDGRWRRYVNGVLRDEYCALWQQVDLLVMLKAPRFAKVYEWRQNQENKLAATTGAGNRVMNREQLQRFIQHYERLTRHGLDKLPELADVVFELTDQQTIANKLKG
jgi:D-glycerate 3-kinase